MADPIVDQDLASLHEDIAIIRTEMAALKMQVTLARWLVMAWVLVSLALFVALILVVAHG